VLRVFCRGRVVSVYIHSVFFTCFYVEMPSAPCGPFSGSRGMDHVINLASVR